MGLQGYIERRLEKDPDFLSHFWFMKNLTVICTPIRLFNIYIEILWINL